MHDDEFDDEMDEPSGHDGDGATVPPTIFEDFGAWKALNDAIIAMVEHPEIHPLLQLQTAVAKVQLEDIDDLDVLKTAFANAIDLVGRIAATSAGLGMEYSEMDVIFDEIEEAHEAKKDLERDD